MSIRRDSLRAQRDFYSPMTGNTGTEIRYAAAPTQTQSKYGSQVKERLSEIGQNTRRSAPIIKAIKTVMKKTDDPFTQIAEKKSYAPQEENQIGAQIQGLASQAEDAVSQAQDAIGEGVSQAETAVQEFKTKSSKRQQERRIQRQSELKAARDERAALRGEVKKIFARDRKRYGNTVPKGSFGSGSKPGPAVDTRPRHAVGGPGDQPKVSKFEKKEPKKTPMATTFTGIGTREFTKKFTQKPKTERQSVAKLPSNYKATEKAAFDKAKRYKAAAAVAKRNPNVSISKKTGKAEATNNSARARAQAAAVNRKMSGKSISQTKAANRASMKAAAAARHASFKKAKAAGTHARTASAQRARNKAAAKARAKAAAKARNKKKNQNRRGGASRRRGRRRGRRCDIFLKFDISLLTNNNLRHDELAEVAYFVRALREVEL